MRRRINKFVDKVLDRSRSPSPVQSRSASKSRAKAKEPTKTIQSGFGDGLKSLNDIHGGVQQESLKKSISGLLQLLDLVNTTVDEDILIKLDTELKRLSDTIRSLSDGALSVIPGRIDDITSDLDNATIKALASVPQDSAGRRTATLNDSAVLSALRDDLHEAVEKFHNKPSPSPNPIIPSSSKRKMARTVSGRVVAVLTVVKESLDGVPAPGLKGAVGGFVEILKAVNHLIDNEEDLIKLLDHLQRLVKIITPPKEINNPHIDAALQKRIDELTIDIEAITADAERIKTQNLSGKLLGNTDNASAIAGLIKAVDQAIARFQVSGGIWIEGKVVQLEQGIGRLEGQLGEGVDKLGHGMGQVEEGMGVVTATLGRVEHKLGQISLGSSTAVEEAALNAIQPRVDNARYNSASQTSSSFCLPNTRVAILGEILKWAIDPNARPMFWLSGMAGTGKTTIARTVAKDFDDKGFLGASFFFSRDEEDRRITARVFPTIAYQLARSKSFCRNQILAAANLDTCTAMMSTQLEKLIVEPLRTVKEPITPPIIFVIDALDECSNENHIIEMIILLSSALRDLRPHINLKIMVTGRPETYIRGQFMKPTMEIISNISHLHEIDKSIVSDDILQYLNYRLKEIRDEVLPEDITWPREEDVNTLVRMADGLFIYVSVAMEYIRQEPTARMRILLAGAGHRKTSYAFKHLDSLYHEVMRSAEKQGAKDDDPEEVVEMMQTIIGTVVTVLDPLSTRSLGLLLKLDDGSVQSRLKHMHSLLSVPASPYPVHMFHKSFPDFLMDQKRSGGDSWYYIDARKHHTRLAILCLNHMNASLRRDLCGVGDLLNSEIQNKDELLDANVQPYLLYACQHWGAHLKGSDHTEELDNALHTFGMTKLLYWLEVLSVAGKLSVGVEALNIAKAQCNDDMARSMFYDCYRFLLFYREAISAGPCHIYKSALPFMPQCRLYEAMEKELGESVKVICGQDIGWSNTLFTLKHSSHVNSVAFSHDGSQIASGSNDQTVMVWDAKTGALINTLKGHSNPVTSVAFSHDGSQIASGSHDQTVMVWDAKTGALINTLKGHSNSVTSVAFSHDGSQIASGSWDMTVMVWDAKTGALINELRQSASVISVEFSLDGLFLKVLDDQNKTTFWDSQTFKQCGAVSNQDQIIPQMVPTDCLYLDERWIMSNIHGRVKHLSLTMVHDISAHSSSGSTFAFGTNKGQMYILNFSSVLS